MSEVSPPEPLEATLARLEAGVRELDREDVSAQDVAHREAMSLAIRQLVGLASRVELQTMRHRRDQARVERLRRGLERVVAYTQREAAHYEELRLGQARAWRHVQHGAEHALEQDEAARPTD